MSHAPSFDPAEKMLEIALRHSAPSLRELPREVWDRVVEASGGAILRAESGSALDAYILSESSLFVGERTVTLLTCGRTLLPRSFFEFLAHIRPTDLSGLRFSRQRDRYPAEALSSFEEDIAELSRTVEGSVESAVSGEEQLASFEVGRLVRGFDFRIFASGIGELKRRIFEEPSARPEALLRGFTLPGDEAELIQIHAFEPTGHSMNWVRGADAFAVHVSPEASANVASVATNSRDAASRAALLERALTVFEPERVAVLIDGRRLLNLEDTRAALKAAGEQGRDAGLV